MAGSPNWKVYNAAGQYVAACKQVVAAAALMEFYGRGATIRYGHGKIVWTEGKEIQPARESYDHVYDVVTERVDAHNSAYWARYHGRIA